MRSFVELAFHASDQSLPPLAIKQRQPGPIGIGLEQGDGWLSGGHDHDDVFIVQLVMATSAAASVALVTDIGGAAARATAAHNVVAVVLVIVIAIIAMPFLMLMDDIHHGDRGRVHHDEDVFTGQDMQLPDPHGMSGGGLWRARFAGSSIWTPDRLKLVGILTEFHEVQREVKANRVENLYHLLSHHFDMQLIQPPANA